MNGKPAYSIVPSTSSRLPPIQDEWGIFDPNQAGLKAAFRAARDMESETAGEYPVPPAAGDQGGQPPPLPDLWEIAAPESEPKSQFRPAGGSLSMIGRDLQRAAAGPRARPAAASARLESASAKISTDDDVYDLTEPTPPRAPAKTAERGAVYTLEYSTCCPQCRGEINTVRVSRLLRTQVSFTSTLPRKGYIIVCPDCDGILSAELSGLI